MTTAYSSTAEALASPLSPINSLSSESAPGRPSFNRIRSSRRRLIVQDDHVSFKVQLFRSAEMVQRKVLSTYKAMSLLQIILAGTALIIIGVLAILFVVFSHRIFGWLDPIADKWRNLPFGWLILWTIICICAFPPVIGYSTAITIAGFLYGFPNGWFVAASSNVLGSLASFVTCRTFLSNYVNNLIGEDRRFNALALVFKHDGLKILVMVRLCPLPYSLLNGAMSTFPTISPFMFTLATVLATPKILIHVFIGSRLADLVKKGGEMDTVTKIVNYVSIAGGALLGIGLGYYIYQRTVARARELELEESQALTRTPRSGGGSRDGDFEDDVDWMGTDMAAGMDNDDISLWDNEDEGYKDDSTDENITTGGYIDEEAAISSRGSKGLGK